MQRSLLCLAVLLAASAVGQNRAPAKDPMNGYAPGVKLPG